MPRAARRPRRPRRPRGDDRGVVGVVNFLLVLGLATSALGTVAGVWDPVVLRGHEESHQRAVQRQLADLAADLDRLALDGALGASVQQRLDLGWEARAVLTGSRGSGVLGLERRGGPAGELNVSGSLVQPRAGSAGPEGPLVRDIPPTTRILAGLDRADPSSLTHFELRVTDVARLARSGEQPSFRIAVLRAGVCQDVGCRQLALSPEDSGQGSDYQDKVIWIASFTRTHAQGLDAMTADVWAHDQASQTSWRANPRKMANVQTLNILCDETTPGLTCPAPRPRSHLDNGLQLWPLLFPGGAGVAGQRYDVWLVNGDRVWGTYRAGGDAPSGAPAGTPPGVHRVPLPAASDALEVELLPRHASPRALRLEHGALLALEGGRAAMLAPPPFSFQRSAPGVVDATLRIQALNGTDPSVAASGAVAVRAELERQVAVQGTAGMLRLRLPTAACAPWQAWFAGTMAGLGLREGSGFTTACDAAAGVVDLAILGDAAEPQVQDLAVRLRWSGFRVGVDG